MSLIVFLIASAVILLVAYHFMGRFLARWLDLTDAVPTPAHTMKDGLDFEPIGPSTLLPQHFSAIAAAGPIVGPILAGVSFGWLPTYIWIILGSIFIGGIHDITTLVASIRHRARSIAEIVRQYMNRRAYMLFLLFIWISLIYVIIAFADVTAGAFIQAGATADAVAPGAAVATSSILYLLLAVAMGLAMKYGKLGATAAKAIFLPLVLAAIVAGPSIPFDLSAYIPAAKPQQVWNYLLLGYCFLASIAPLWLLLQPRGELGGYFLYFIIGAGILGIFVGGLSGELTIQAPAFSEAAFFTSSGNLPPLFPILFITVACGACSGFHSIVTSGTTSKQLRTENDAKPVAYGSMLLEAFFACISLATIMIIAAPKGKPDALYANGISQFLHHATFGFLSVTTAYQFALLCFATFVFDTLDAATRLARYILMELTGWTGRSGIALATAVTLAFPAIIASLPPATMAGKTLPLWQVFWGLFGSSNQLLAALALMAVTVWLWKIGKPCALPLFGTFFMLFMTLWSLGYTTTTILGKMQEGPVPILKTVELTVGVVLIGLTLWLVGEAFMTWFETRSETGLELEEAEEGATP
ncbi:MAG: carbon starvation CstA family protein [Candidatus Hydrogenedentota bacterium]